MPHRLADSLIRLLCWHRALKGLSPSHSQQLELEDALASTAYMEGPCGPPDDGLSKQPYLWRCFASCIHFWGAPSPAHLVVTPQSFLRIALRMHKWGNCPRQGTCACRPCQSSSSRFSVAVVLEDPTRFVLCERAGCDTAAGSPERL